MSTENIRLFFERAKTDAPLREKIAEISRQPGHSKNEALAQLSAQVGTPFTAEEFIGGSPKLGQLTDADLETVVGGVNTGTYDEMWAQDVAAMIGYHSGATASGRG